MNNRRVALVSGGTSGIGRAITDRLIKSGYHVIAVGRSRAHISETISAIDQPSQSKFSYVEGDLRESGTLTAIVKKLEQEPNGLQVLINAAGTIGHGGVEEETTETWNLVLEVNLTCAFLLTKTCLPFLRRSFEASIVNVSSVCSFRTCSSVSYSVSKAGLDMLTKCLAKELASSKIRVNSINPGVVSTNLQTSAGLFQSKQEYAAWIEQMAKFHPLGRVGTGDDIAAMAEFLVSDDASWITGGIFSVDGGRGVA